jgi:hypothetical protein
MRIGAIIADNPLFGGRMGTDYFVFASLIIALISLGLVGYGTLLSTLLAVRQFDVDVRKIATILDFRQDREYAEIRITNTP